MKGPFYTKNEKERISVIQPCLDCMYYSRGCKDPCLMPDCPFYFTDYEEDEEDKE